jgi:hypothetical protein
MSDALSSVGTLRLAVRPGTLGAGSRAQGWSSAGTAGVTKAEISCCIYGYLARDSCDRLSGAFPAKGKP